jgi:hypothetical protein
MTTKDLTKVERRVAKNYYEKGDMKYDLQNIDIKFIREIMERTAYHESGHFAARVFTRLELYFVQSISIIPDERNMGYMRYECLTENILDIHPFKKQNGYMLLLEMLAGYGAQMIHEKAKYNNLLEYLSEEQDEEWEDYFDDKRLDINRARRIASIMSKPHWSKDRIIFQAAKWTMEMLSIPSVWNTVEATAKILLSKGEVTLSNREISKIAYDSNVPYILKIPKWEKRISEISKKNKKKSIKILNPYG